MSILEEYEKLSPKIDNFLKEIEGELLQYLQGKEAFNKEGYNDMFRSISGISNDLTNKVKKLEANTYDIYWKQKRKHINPFDLLNKVKYPPYKTTKGSEQYKSTMIYIKDEWIAVNGDVYKISNITRTDKQTTVTIDSETEFDLYRQATHMCCNFVLNDNGVEKEVAFSYFDDSDNFHIFEVVYSGKYR